MTKVQGNTTEQRQSFQQVVLKQLDDHMQKMKADKNFTPFTKNNSKWIIHLNVQCKTTKIQEDDIGENLGTRFVNEFVDTIPKT